jgi:sortase A
MFLKVGVILMTVAVALAVGVAVVIGLRSGNPASAPADPLAAETATKNFDPGEKPETNDGAPAPSEKRGAKTLPVFAEDWPRPSSKEIATAKGPRYYQPEQDAELTLTVERLGLYDVPVINSESPEALDRGVIHLPETPMPWDERPQKNVYIAGHRTGYPGTGSRMVFYNLDKLKKGDSVVLKDSSGTPYEYRVSEMFAVKPDAVWAVDPVRGRDMLTLQSCTYPSFENRIIVRADRV